MSPPRTIANRTSNRLSGEDSLYTTILEYSPSSLLESPSSPVLYTFRMLMLPAFESIICPCLRSILPFQSARSHMGKYMSLEQNYTSKGTAFSTFLFPSTTYPFYPNANTQQSG